MLQLSLSTSLSSIRTADATPNGATAGAFSLALADAVDQPPDARLPDIDPALRQKDAGAGKGLPPAQLDRGIDWFVGDAAVPVTAPVAAPGQNDEAIVALPVETGTGASRRPAAVMSGRALAPLADASMPQPRLARLRDRALRAASDSVALPVTTAPAAQQVLATTVSIDLGAAMPKPEAAQPAEPTESAVDHTPSSIVPHGKVEAPDDRPADSARRSKKHDDATADAVPVAALVPAALPIGVAPVAIPSVPVSDGAPAADAATALAGISAVSPSRRSVGPAPGGELAAKGAPAATGGPAAKGEPAAKSEPAATGEQDIPGVARPPAQAVAWPQRRPIAAPAYPARLARVQQPRQHISPKVSSASAPEPASVAEPAALAPNAADRIDMHADSMAAALPESLSASTSPAPRGVDAPARRSPASATPMLQRLATPYADEPLTDQAMVAPVLAPPASPARPVPARSNRPIAAAAPARLDPTVSIADRLPNPTQEPGVPASTIALAPEQGESKADASGPKTLVPGSVAPAQPTRKPVASVRSAPIAAKLLDETSGVQPSRAVPDAQLADATPTAAPRDMAPAADPDPVAVLGAQPTAVTPPPTNAASPTPPTGDAAVTAPPLHATRDAAQGAAVPAPPQPLVPQSSAASAAAPIVAAGTSASVQVPLAKPVSGSTPKAVDAAPRAAVVMPPVQAAAVPRSPIVAPAAIVFSAALATAFADRQASDDRRGPIDPAVAAATLLQPHQSTAASAAADQQGPLDMHREDWPQAMIDRIETLRDAADATDTHIRLMPDSLGRIDVSLHHDGDTVHVQFAAQAPATQAMLNVAQPKLAELAEARGLRIAQTMSDGTAAGGGQQQRSSTPQPHLSARPASAFRSAAPADADTRLA